MFITAFENFILFTTLLSLCGFAAAVFARISSECGRRRWQPEMLSRIYAAAIVLPTLIAAWITAAALLPEWWLGEAAFDTAHPQPLHRLHLLGELTARLEPVLAYVTVTLAASAALFAAWLGLRSYLRLGRLIERFDVSAVLPQPEQLASIREIATQSGLQIGLVMSDQAFSFVWGFYRSRLVLSSGLLNMLTPNELWGVVAHETAHHSRRDNLIKLLLSLCSYTSLAFPLSRIVAHWRSAQVELLCDEVASARTCAPLDIADALVKLRRKAITTIPGATMPGMVSGFSPLNSLGLERRVQRLLELSDALPAPERTATLQRPRSSRIIFFLTLSALALFAVTFIAPLAVHEAAEALIHGFR